MNYIILSCNRKPSYLSQTLASAPDVGWRISWGSKETDTLPNAVPYNQMQFPAMFDHMGVMSKSTYNYAHALMMGDDEAVIVEDDIKFSSMFLENVAQVSKQHFSKTIIALYSAWDWNSKVDDHLQCILPYEIDNFFGTQAMYYTKDIRKPLSDFMTAHCGKEPYDLLIKSYCRLNPDTKLLALRYSIAQHTGVESTGLGHHHTTGNYVP